jgi:hypothetical protein
MAIYESDIKLLESQRLTDNEDGGGRITGNEIVDGEANNIFPDISSLDRVYGRVNLRKAYPAIQTPNTDTYYGSHLIIADPPEDPNVHVTLFDTEDWTDQRADSRQRVEAYVVMGPEMRGYLLGTQYEGQRQITILQGLDAPIPEIGTTMVLDLDADGYTPRRQYVRVTGVDHSEVEYEDDRGTYTRRRVRMDISEPLRHDFPGHEPSRFRATGSTTTVRETVVADAARYYSITPLTEPAEIGGLIVRCDRVFTPLVPSTQAETPITDEWAAATVPVPVESGGETVEAQDVVQTGEISVTLANRGYNYVFPCVPRPAPGTLSVSYRAQGRWYSLRDDGNGQLEGVGTGSVDYTTGTAQVTLAELPDVPSSVMFAWGAGEAVFHDRAGTEGDLDAPRIEVEAGVTLLPGSVTVTWMAGGSTKTATDDGKGGLSGDAGGAVFYPTGLVILEPAVSVAPDYQSVIQVQGEEGPSTSSAYNPSIDSAGVAQINLGEGVMPGSVNIEFRVKWSEERINNQIQFAGYNRGSSVSESSERTVRVKDDGSGGLISDGANLGTVDYATGEITLTVERDQEWQKQWTTWWSNLGQKTQIERQRLASAIAVRYFPAGVAGSQVTANVDAPRITGNILGLLRETITPGSLRFRWRGSTYEDRDGDLVINPDPSTGFGQVAGSIRYDTGDVEFTEWGSGTQSLSVDRLVTARGQITADTLTFRIAGAPLRNQSLIVQVLTTEGDLITITGDPNGVLTDDTNRTDGLVDWETGVVSLRFGLWVGGEFTQAEEGDQEGEPPTLILPGSARYSAVVFRSIPLDADLLGLDPVRLPSDGRVPFIRPGNVAVIHNTQTTDIGDGTGTTTLRPRLTYCHVYDSEGARLTDDRLTLDLDAGTVEVLDPSGHAPPFTAEHRIEDMRLVSEVQITGYVSLASALTHDYPAEDTYLSTALLYGDLQAGWIDPWAQTTWNNVWSDEQQGDSPTATLNTTDYPIVVTNEGAIQERWLLRFVSTSAVNVIGEYTGQILTNITISEDIAPTNPNTGVPYFTIPAAAWGGGWSTGNAVRFNTRAANRPVWIARTVLASDETTDSDQFRLQIRGDAQ